MARTATIRKTRRMGLLLKPLRITVQMARANVVSRLHHGCLHMNLRDASLMMTVELHRMSDSADQKTHTAELQPKMAERFVVFVVLLLIALLAIGSYRRDALSFDGVPHIPSGP